MTTKPGDGKGRRRLRIALRGWFKGKPKAIPTGNTKTTLGLAAFRDKPMWEAVSDPQPDRDDDMLGALEKGSQTRNTL